MQRPRAIYHINPDFRGIYRIYFMFEKVSTRIHQLQDFEPPFAEIFGQVVIIYSRYLSELNSSVRAISDPLNHLQSRNSYIGTLKITLNTNKNLHSFSPFPSPPLQCCGFLGFPWQATNIVRWGRRTKNFK